MYVKIHICIYNNLKINFLYLQTRSYSEHSQLEAVKVRVVFPWDPLRQVLDQLTELDTHVFLNTEIRRSAKFGHFREA